MVSLPLIHINNTCSVHVVSSPNNCYKEVVVKLCLHLASSLNVVVSIRFNEKRELCH